MDDKTRKPDAGAEAPRPKPKTEPEDARERAQDGPNKAERTDGGRAIPGGDLSSANDE